MEQQFHALRRLVASKAGFAGFTNLPGFREKIGVKVNKALKLGKDVFRYGQNTKKIACHVEVFRIREDPPGTLFGWFIPLCPQKLFI